MRQFIRKSLTILLAALTLSLNTTAAFAVDEIEPYYYSTPNNTAVAAEFSNPILVPVEGSAQSYEGYHGAAAKLSPNTSASYKVNVPAAGAYYLGVDYFIPEKEMSELTVALTVNGRYQFYDSRNLQLEAAWKDAYPEYLKDEYGNDLFPEPDRVYRWLHKDFNSTLYNLSYPYLFNLEAGENTVTITNNEVGCILGDLTVMGKQQPRSFQDYKSALPKTQAVTAPPIVIEGEKYSEKTRSHIRGTKGNDHTVTPYDPTKKLINTLSGSMWSAAGDGVSYTFNIEEPGIYYITFKYQLEETLPAFKQIRIDGEYLFDEMRNYPFTYEQKWRNETLNINGENIPLYFDSGEHTISLVGTAQMYYEAYESLMQVISRANELALEIKVITGNKTDKNRDWEIEQYIPTLSDELKKCADTVMKEYTRLSSMSSKNLALINNLKVAATRLNEFSMNLNWLVNNLDQFVQGSSSVTEYISLVMPYLTRQMLYIDQITVSASPEEAAPAEKGFMYGAKESVKKFFLSFSPAEDVSGSIKPDELSVWVNRSVAHLDVLKEMAVGFESENGAKVNMSLMPDEQKLLLAVSAGNAPDAVIGMSNYRPFDFAMRGAMYDMREFEDFGQSIKSFCPDMLIPFIIDDSCYALPETANFQVLFYRKDIMNALQLKVPRTWDDVLSILPTLSRYGMDFGTQIATSGGNKSFAATVPFIHQFDGKLYSDDGTRVELGDPKTVEAFKLMTDLYTKYSLPENIPNFFNNFKKGITPIGISDVNTYVLLRNAAPEIAGQWGIAPSVGIMGDDGELKNYQISVQTANGIMKDANDPQLAWDFLKWYMSDAVQINYANQLQLRYGPEYIWNTANMNALAKSAAFSGEDKVVILEQLQQTREIPRNPAYFAVERELSNAWNATVFDGVSPRTALDRAITLSNREISKKLKEFGYMDEKGNVIKPFKMATGDTVKAWMDEGEG